MNHRQILSTLLFPLTLCATPLLAQDVREQSAQTGYAWYHGVPASTITTAISNGYRPVDLEIESSDPLRFTTTMVRNTGEYQSGFWWYYGLTSSQLSAHLSTNQARLIDLEVYDDGGQTRFAAVMVPNTGANAKTWWYYHGQTGAQVANLLSTNNARPIDFESYEINGTTYYSVVMIRNTGADYRNFAWYYNTSAATVQASIANGRRVYDLHRRPNGNFDAVLVTENSAPNFTWWYGLDSAGVSERLGNYGHRPLEIQPYFVNGAKRFAMVTINNSNELTTSVGAQMRNTTDGTVGLLLRRINSGELAALNGSRVFEPASTMKTLHHVHAFRRLRLGQIALNGSTTVFLGTNGSCPLDVVPIGESWTGVLRAMMEQSDNNRTQAVTAFFSQAALNNTAAALGMTNTSLNHRIGCAGPALANPNEITLRDLATLHTEVANGYLGTFRDAFYEHMLNSLGWAGISSVIDQEAASLGVSAAALTSFKASCELARKGGSYTLNGSEYRSGFGWIRIPFLSGNQLAPREYAVGAFVDGASNGTNASTAVNNAVAELLRPTLRSALSTWNVTAVAASVGTGCGSPQALTQSVTGLPRLGQTPIYRVLNAQPNSLVAMTFGFNNQQWGATALPASLAFAGAAGCFVYNDAAATMTLVASGSGQGSVSINLPNHHSFLGMQYFTQFFGFGGTLRTSNGMRSVVGD